MSGGERMKISCEEIQRVQNGIEQCLRHYMNQKEVMDLLLVRDNIEPRFAKLVWQKLEEENQEFFKAYYLRLMVKDQIMEFNKLLSEQVNLMGRLEQAGMVSIPMANGSHASSTHQNSAGGFGIENGRHTMKPENMQLPLAAALPNVFSPSRPSMHSSMQRAVDMSSHVGNIDVTGNMLLAQSSNRGTPHSLGGVMIKPEPDFAGSLPFDFRAHNHLVEHRAVMGDASVSSFSSAESNSQPLNETLLDPDASPFAYFGNFGLPDLSADFSNEADILESFSRSSFLAPDTNHFFDTHNRGHNQGDVTRLNTAPNNMRYQDHGGD